ncbi:FAD/NAD(P)-binding protein [Nocardioides sp. B-3]|nr:FAD/NAD(P)-binding protein [Nocardioides sp. B-3]UUZ60267.1 FAD/NAD(P)-binding protein [Nocardioides sp. B-3]
MSESLKRPQVVVIGAGAAGTPVAIHLARNAHQRGTSVDLVLVDPADRAGRGTAFGTTDDEHLLNVPAAGMTALPQDPGHFVAWRAPGPRLRSVPGRLRAASPVRALPRRDPRRHARHGGRHRLSASRPLVRGRGAAGVRRGERPAARRPRAHRRRGGRRHGSPRCGTRPGAPSPRALAVLRRRSVGAGRP